MSATMMMTAATPIDFAYEQNGQVRCLNTRGLIFFLQAEPPAPAKPAQRSWSAVEATHEVEVRREANEPAIVETARALPDPARAAFTTVASTREVEVRRDLPFAAPVRGTGALPNAAAAGQLPEKGWFNKLFKK